MKGGGALAGHSRGAPGAAHTRPCEPARMRPVTRFADEH